MTIVIPCEYGGPDHEYPDDWQFGGFDGLHPGLDSRFEPTHYQYLDAEAGFCFMTGSFLCDDEALDKFTRVAMNSDPVYIAVKRPGDPKYALMPYKYVQSEDTVYPTGEIK